MSESVRTNRPRAIGCKHTRHTLKRRVYPFFPFFPTIVTRICQQNTPRKDLQIIKTKHFLHCTVELKKKKVRLIQTPPSDIGTSSWEMSEAAENKMIVKVNVRQ